MVTKVVRFGVIAFIYVVWFQASSFIRNGNFDLENLKYDILAGFAVGIIVLTIEYGVTRVKNRQN